MRTITELERTLEKERKDVAKGKLLKGMFGINECKKSIEFDLKYSGKTLNELYVEYITHCLKSNMYNSLMIVACELIMKEKGLIK